LLLSTNGEPLNTQPIFLALSGPQPATPDLGLSKITSNIDSKTEEIIQNTLISLKSEGIIVLMVAHRLSTVLLSDSVALISNGVIVASGTHSELLKTSSEYKKLYSLQLIKDE